MVKIFTNFVTPSPTVNRQYKIKLYEHIQILLSLYDNSFYAGYLLVSFLLCSVFSPGTIIRICNSWSYTHASSPSMPHMVIQILLVFEISGTILTFKTLALSMYIFEMASKKHVVFWILYLIFTLYRTFYMGPNQMHLNCLKWFKFSITYITIIGLLSMILHHMIRKISSCPGIKHTSPAFILSNFIITILIIS